MVKKIIGVISDTHGLLREEAGLALTGTELIIHAGDVGSPEILRQLSKITEVVAVRGNTDRAEWARELPITQYLEFAGLNIYVIHDLQQMGIDPVAAGVNIVISGHSHQPLEKRSKGILYLNPGSAGPKRFSLPISIAVLKIKGDQIETEFINL